MMIDDDTLKWLLRIDDELTSALQMAERKTRHRSFVSLDTRSWTPSPTSCKRRARTNCSRHRHARGGNHGKFIQSTTGHD